MRWYGLPTLGLGLAIAIVAIMRFSLLEPDPPANPDDVCEIFREHPVWYDYASRSRERWGTPIATQMAFVYYESSFRSHARPPRTRLLGFIPWRRPTSAYGYAQALALSAAATSGVGDTAGPPGDDAAPLPPPPPCPPAVGRDSRNVADGGASHWWASQLETLEAMGFSRDRSLEMLALCDGDAEAAIQLLCS